MITFIVDELTPCLKSVETGDFYDTEVVQVKRKSFLSKFNRKTGWYVNWSKFENDVEIYALVLKGTMDIQGMIAVAYDDIAKAVHIIWGCTAPHNNKWQYERQKYVGVGGHLLAIAGELSERRGFDGFVYGEAIDKELYAYYLEKFGALPLPPRGNPYNFMISGETIKQIRKVYDYEWTDEVL